MKTKRRLTEGSLKTNIKKQKISNPPVLPPGGPKKSPRRWASFIIGFIVERR